jgi:hypothetical protein
MVCPLFHLLIQALLKLQTFHLHGSRLDVGSYHYPHRPSCWNGGQWSLTPLSLTCFQVMSSPLAFADNCQEHTCMLVPWYTVRRLGDCFTASVIIDWLCTLRHRMMPICITFNSEPHPSPCRGSPPPLHCLVAS